MRRLRTTGGLLIMMMLLASCIRVDANIRVEDDGSGTVDFLSALNTEALTSVLSDFDVPESEFGDTADLCNEFESDFSVAADLPDGATFTPYDEDGFCGTRVQYAFGPSSDASAQIQSVLEDPGARLYQDGDNWFFETSIDTEDLTSEASDAPQAMIDALFGDASYTITVDLPGRAIAGENNATSVGDDGVFTWDIDILNPPTRLFAQTEPGSGGGSGGGGGSNLLWIALIVLALAALIGFFLWKRKSDAAGSTPPPGSAFEPSAAMAPPSATMPAGSPMALQDTVALPGGSLPGAASMPLVDGPAVTATPPAGIAESARETVVINSADIQQSLGNHVTDAAAASTEPVFDEALNAWVVDDPTRGRLRHDPATDSWHSV